MHLRLRGENPLTLGEVAHQVSAELVEETRTPGKGLAAWQRRQRFAAKSGPKCAKKLRLVPIEGTSCHRMHIRQTQILSPNFYPT